MFREGWHYTLTQIVQLLRLLKLIHASHFICGDIPNKFIRWPILLRLCSKQMESPSQTGRQPRLQSFGRVRQRPLKFNPVVMQKGRFARTKSQRSGHISVTAKKRYTYKSQFWRYKKLFLGASCQVVSWLLLPPRVGSIVDAICVKLCDSITGCKARWNNMLSDLWGRG